MTTPTNPEGVMSAEELLNFILDIHISALRKETDAELALNISLFSIRRRDAQLSQAKGEGWKS